MNPGAIDLPLLAPAFVAGLLVLATHVPLGAQVLQRGIVFIDLAIAQIAALGVIVASLGEGDPRGWTVQVAAAVAALLGALLLTWTEKRWPKVQEAQIGTLFVLNFAGATAIGLGLLLPVERLFGRLGGVLPALLALGGIGLAATAFVFLFVSERTPLFGFMEPGYDPTAILASRVAEFFTVAFLTGFLAVSATRRAGHPEQG